jgi:hypothetical protein
VEAQVVLMTTFLNKADPSQKFYYSIGPVYTRIPWSKPRIKLECFLKDFLSIAELKNYNAYLVGGIVNKTETWDIDIIINGPLKISNLEKIFQESYIIALNKHKVLLDLKWMDAPPSDTLEPKIYQAVQYGLIRKQIGNQVSTINLFEKNIRISDNLVSRKISFPNNKNNQFNLKYIKLCQTQP